MGGVKQGQWLLVSEHFCHWQYVLHVISLICYAHVHWYFSHNADMGRMYALHINQRYHRSGTLWEKRDKYFLVQQETYLIDLYRYSELNPVRLRI